MMVVLQEQDSLKTAGNGTQEIQDTLKQKYKHEKSPQVRKTGVDAVHRKLPTEVQTCEKL